MANSFVDIKDTSETIQVDIKYSSKDNFLNRPLHGYTANTCLLTKNTANALNKAQNEFIKLGYGIKVFDCFRPQEAVEDMYNEVAINEGKNVDTKFSPNIDKAKLIELGYISKKTKHTIGNTVDLTLINLKDNKELNMGGSFDLFDEISHTKNKSISPTEQKNRKIFVDIMMKNGFRNYKKEWWHFTYTE